MNQLELSFRLAAKRAALESAQAQCTVLRAEIDAIRKQMAPAKPQSAAAPSKPKASAPPKKSAKPKTKKTK